MKLGQVAIGPGLLLVLLSASCGGGSSPAGPSADSVAYPRYIDANVDRVNDYIQPGTHDPGTATGHAFVDANGDGVCDYAQDGSPTWHGPGFVDANANGICDRWDTGGTPPNQPGSLAYRDDNRDGINDFVEPFGHGQAGHSFVDANGDGICDLAQQGNATWHGPGYVDADGDGTPDSWQQGGMPGGSGPGSGGGMPGGGGPGSGGGMQR